MYGNIQLYNKDKVALTKEYVQQLIGLAEFNQNDNCNQMYTHPDIYTTRYIHNQIYTHPDIYTSKE